MFGRRGGFPLPRIKAGAGLCLQVLQDNYQLVICWYRSGLPVPLSLIMKNITAVHPEDKTHSRVEAQTLKRLFIWLLPVTQTVPVRDLFMLKPPGTETPGRKFHLEAFVLQTM